MNEETIILPVSENQAKPVTDYVEILRTKQKRVPIPGTKKFVRYSNRKYYSYDEKCYSSLPEILHLHRSGVSIEVIFCDNQEDVTLETLFRGYYERYVNTKVLPSPDELKILHIMQEAQNDF